MSRYRTPRQPIREWLQVWLRQHRDAVLKARDYFRQSWLTSALTMIAIAVALAIPAAGLLAMQSAGQLFDFDTPRQITAYMKLDVDGQRLADIAKVLTQRPDVDKVDVMTRQQSLDEFRRQTGLDDALDLLPDNPLPAVLLIHPADSIRDSAALAGLRDEIRQNRSVEDATIDADWLNKLLALIETVRRLAWLAGITLAISVLLLIHYSLHSQIIRRHEEIQVVKLVGGSGAYIRRPFLYYAILLGAGGGLLALLMLKLALVLLAPSLQALSNLYHLEFTLSLPAMFAIGLVIAGIILSIAAALLTINALLRRIEPGTH